MSDFIVWFDRYRDSDRGRVGGKNASLGEMIEAGMPVPPGFAVTTEAYHTLRDHDDVRRAVHSALQHVDLSDPAGLEKISQNIRTAIDSVGLDADLEVQIKSAYAELCDRCELDDVPVAVRSSATAEDLPDASFAGEHDTFLWVRTLDQVLASVRRCWSSIFTSRAISYRHEMGHDHEVISMSVGIQQMVQPKAAGVAFTLNPTDGDRSVIAIDSSWGLGEAVVGGEVNPDNFLVDKVLYEIVRRTISPKAKQYRVADNGGVELVDVQPECRDQPSLTDSEVRAVAKMARAAERHYGAPQDVEWAIDCNATRGDGVVLLQSRPETVWSRRRREPIARGSGIESIVTTLLSPLNARKSKGKEEGKSEK